MHELPSDSELRHTPLLALHRPLLVSIDHALLSALNYDEVRKPTPTPNPTQPQPTTLKPYNPNPYPYLNPNPNPDPDPDPCPCPCPSTDNLQISYLLTSPLLQPLTFTLTLDPKPRFH